MKLCPFCKKELPDEAEFCPYCMQRFSEVNQISPVPVRKKSKKMLWLLAIPIVVVLIVIGWLMWQMIGQNSPDKSESVPSSSYSQVKTTDYSNYVGVWLSKEVTSANAEKQYDGGTTLEIITIKNDVVRFNLTRISDAPQNRIARLDNITAEIVDGIATFSFEDDGWQNSGTGKLKFSPDEIYMETTVLEKNPNALWSINGKAYLTKREDSVRDLYLMGFDLVSEFDSFRDLFGEETQDVTTEVYDLSEAHHYGELKINVNPDNGLVVSYAVNYEKSDNKSHYAYHSIDGNSTVEDVIKVMGQPVLNSLNDSTREIGYGITNGFIKFMFDDNMNVIAIYAFVPD